MGNVLSWFAIGLLVALAVFVAPFRRLFVIEIPVWVAAVFCAVILLPLLIWVNKLRKKAARVEKQLARADADQKARDVGNGFPKRSGFINAWRRWIF